jgi:hypothetical protein
MVFKIARISNLGNDLSIMLHVGVKCRRPVQGSLPSQASSKLLYGLGEWEMEGRVNLLMTQEASLSL